jgi:putative transposase
LQNKGLGIGRRRTARLMRENGLKARQTRRFKRTTDVITQALARSGIR